MNNQINVRKTEGKYVKAIVTFPIQKGRKTASIEVVQRITGGFFYVQSGCYGQVFNNYEQLQNNYVGLREVTEYEFLGGQ